MTLRFLTAPNIASVTSIAHGFSLRTGGVSKPPLDSLNLGLHVGDVSEAVYENRSRVAQAFELTIDRMICAEQVHGGNVAMVSEADAGRSARAFAEAIPGVDSLVTNTPQLLLALFFADCVPVFYVDERRGVVAVAHAGWRGMVAGVLENTLETMRENFGTAPGDVQAAIGPCIGRAHFEVGPEVAAHFPDNTIVTAPRHDKAHVDLAQEASQRLMRAGVLPDNVFASGECTVANSTDYFSHRRDHGRTGRMGAFITLRP